MGYERLIASTCSYVENRGFPGYSNYEAPAGQFRIRVRASSPLVTGSNDASNTMEEGGYVVQQEDLPITQIYQCDDKDLTKLCMRDLTAGEKNGRIGYHPARL